jgi:hypothetical protein
MLPIAIFWLAFTSYTSVHWAAPMMSGLLLGMSLILLFLPLSKYSHRLAQAVDIRCDADKFLLCHIQ